MYFYFTSPNNLYFLFLIPILIFFHFYNIKNIKSRSLRFANFEAIARIKGIDLYSKSIIFLILNIVMIFSLVFSISGLTFYTEMESSSFSFIVAIDSSESMGADDIAPDRLTAAKETSIDFINSLPYNSRIGVISFSGNSFIEQELTNNKQQLETAINGIELTRFGGTDIYEAISISASLLRDEENKAIIVLSDGQINIGNIVETVEFARDKMIIVHTFGIGTKEGGLASYGISKIDEESLRSLAYSSKGSFFNIDSKEKMEQAFKEIAPLTRKMGGINLSFYLILITMFIFILEQFLVDVLKISI